VTQSYGRATYEAALPGRDLSAALLQPNAQRGDGLVTAPRARGFPADRLPAGTQSRQHVARLQRRSSGRRPFGTDRLARRRPSSLIGSFICAMRSCISCCAAICSRLGRSPNVISSSGSKAVKPERKNWRYTIRSAQPSISLNPSLIASLPRLWPSNQLKEKRLRTITQSTRAPPTCRRRRRASQHHCGIRTRTRYFLRNRVNRSQHAEIEKTVGEWGQYRVGHQVGKTHQVRSFEGVSITRKSVERSKLEIAVSSAANSSASFSTGLGLCTRET
jgi:hypothetical protein